jgi:hypothetical protein
MGFPANKITVLNAIWIMDICAQVQMEYHWLYQPIVYHSTKLIVIKIMDSFATTLELMLGAIFIIWQVTVLL